MWELWSCLDFSGSLWGEEGPARVRRQELGEPGDLQLATEGDKHGKPDLAHGLGGLQQLWEQICRWLNPSIAGRCGRELRGQVRRWVGFRLVGKPVRPGGTEDTGLGGWWSEIEDTGSVSYGKSYRGGNRDP